MNALQLPRSDNHFQSLFDGALASWFPELPCEEHAILGRKTYSGLSGAVIRDFHVLKGAGNLEIGSYILKLSMPPREGRPTEPAAHIAAWERNTDYSEQHLPALKEQFIMDSDDGPWCATLFTISGGTLDLVHDVQKHEAPELERIGVSLIRDLLEAWTDDAPDSRPQSPGAILKSWLGYRLDSGDSRARKLHEAVAQRCRDASIFNAAGELFASPLAFGDLVDQEPSEGEARDPDDSARDPILCYRGQLHGDLHGGNILVPRHNSANAAPNSYWLIDMALSSEGPALFDIAYLEVDRLLTCLQHATVENTITAIVRSDRGGESPPGTDWWLRRILEWRTVVSEWGSSFRDATQLQFLLARVAAGLRWANRFVEMDSNKFEVALAYSGWAARLFLEQVGIWERFSAQHDARPRVAPSPEEQRRLWNITKLRAGGLDRRSGGFILVAEGMDPGLPLAALGQLPWSAIVDMDADSDRTGLMKDALPVLQSRRGVHVVSEELPKELELMQGTAWMMANGWQEHGQQALEFDQFYDRLAVIRGLGSGVRQIVSPSPVYIVVAPGAHYDDGRPMARLTEAVAALYEVVRGGEFEIILLGNRELTKPVGGCEPEGLEVESFVRLVAEEMGTHGSAGIAELPGESGPVVIDLERLRRIQAHSQVLHSGILDDPESSCSDDGYDAFWRGGEVTWMDLHEGRDVERDVQRELVETVREKLESRQNYTVTLDHLPGTGGTTVSRRVAWDLREDFPCLVLTSYSSLLVDHLDYIAQATKLPVLVVAEDTELPQTTLDEIYRDLSNRGTRVVIVYVRRTMEESSSDLQISRSMGDTEARRFLRVYRAITTDPDRREQLQDITQNAELARYRSPFFYGLITFGRDFRGLQSYVEEHLQGVDPESADHRLVSALKYMALATIYSNSGLPEVVLETLLGFNLSPGKSLEMMLGDGPVQLVSRRRGIVRFLHQYIAEQVLGHVCQAPSDGWQQELPTMSISMIRDLAKVASASLSLRELMRQLFIHRPRVAEDEDRSDFSPLIEDILNVSTDSNVRQVFSTLIEEFDDEAHFLLHAGRFEVYKMGSEGAIKAEPYLMRAVELDPKSVTFHVAGVVFKNQLGHIIADRDIDSPSEALKRGATIQAKAAGAFERSIELDQGNMYPYVDYADMIVHMTWRLIRLAGARTIAEMPEEEGAVRRWLEETPPIADQLLDEAEKQYRGLDSKRASKAAEVRGRLRRLYGDLDEAIRVGELALERSVATPSTRRFLANCYLNREDRVWGRLPENELRRIAELALENLNRGKRSDGDFHLWFGASRHLPDFDRSEAVSLLDGWHLDRGDESVWPAYYLYVLHFWAWFQGESDSLKEYDAALEACKKSGYGKRGWSYFWLSAGDDSVPVRDDKEMVWDQGRRFWSDEDKKGLRQINGIVTRIRPQAGTIKINNKVEVFFVPNQSRGEPFVAGDEPVSVTFYVGFSFEGLRAWEVGRGELSDGKRTPYGSEAPRQKVSLKKLTQLGKPKPTVDFAPVLRLVEDLVHARVGRGDQISLKEIAARVGAVLRVPDPFESLGVDPRTLLEEDFELYGDSGGEFIRPRHARAVDPQAGAGRLVGIVNHVLHQNDGFLVDLRRHKIDRPAGKPDFYLAVNSIKKGQFYSFTPTRNDQGLHAGLPKLLKREQVALPEPDAFTLREEVEAFLTEELIRAPDRSLPIREALNRVNRKFGSCELLCAHLGEPGDGLLPIINRLQGIAVRGAAVYLSDEEELVFGRDGSTLVEPSRIPRDARPPIEGGPIGSSGPLDLDQVLQVAAEMVLEKGGNYSDKYLVIDLDERLEEGGNLLKRLGFRNLESFCQRIPRVSYKLSFLSPLADEPEGARESDQGAADAAALLADPTSVVESSRKADREATLEEDRVSTREEIPQRAADRESVGTPGGSEEASTQENEEAEAAVIAPPTFASREPERDSNPQELGLDPEPTLPNSGVAPLPMPEQFELLAKLSRAAEGFLAAKDSKDTCEVAHLFKVLQLARGDSILTQLGLSSENELMERLGLVLEVRGAVTVVRRK